MKNRKNQHRTANGLRKFHIPSPRLPKDYPWKVIAALTSDLDSFLTNQDLEQITNVARKRDVDGLLELAETWGLQSINLNDRYSVAEIAARYQLSSLLKRYPFESEKSAREETAFNKFKKAEEMCAQFNHIGWRELANPASEDIVDIFTYARGFVHRVLGDMPMFNEVTKWSRHGPGATLSTIAGHNSQYAKFANWPYDVTKAAIGHARHLISEDARWLGALEDNYRDVMEIPKHFILNQEVFWSNVFNVVEGNRVTFVPKDARTERTIAIEPTMNLYLQLGVDGYIRRELKPFGINIDDQEKNQSLAEIGSIYGSYATIDLAAASDSISIQICRLLLPPIWFRYLIDLRSPSGELKDENFVYQKISSMGNGYTFALESLLFGSVIYAVLKHFCGSVNSKDFSVFGDDLIIKTEFAQELIFYLRRFGFSVNPEKTFLKGPIRESCGTDWFQGRLIRPVFIDEFPMNAKQLFSARNRLKRKLNKQWAIDDSQVVSLLDSWCPEKLLGLIGPPSEDDFDSYRHMPYPYGIKFSRGQYYKYRRLVYTPKAFRGPQFHFRKLMAYLRPKDEQCHTFVNKSNLVQVAALEGGGSCFMVTRRNRVIMSVVTSQAYYWPETYLT